MFRKRRNKVTQTLGEFRIDIHCVLAPLCSGINIDFESGCMSVYFRKIVCCFSSFSNLQRLIVYIVRFALKVSGQTLVSVA